MNDPCSSCLVVSVPTWGAGTSPGRPTVRSNALSLFLGGDVMLGRGVDQILGCPGDPTLHEQVVRDARRYVELAERENGPVPRRVDPAYPWGDALGLLDRFAADVRVINLETSITTSDAFEVGKAVHYRMHPRNLPSLEVARPDVCVLANNHVLDFGQAGLLETLDVLDDAGLRPAGAGQDRDAAHRPVAVPLPDGGRLLVTAWGMGSSGIPSWWAANGDRPGVAYLSEPSAGAASMVVDTIQAHRRPGDLVVASVHWGPNWGFDVTNQETAFAHALIEGGVDVVFGHSSHHPRPVEIYRGRLVLYGCGDLVDDYEGIGGHTEFRPDLRLLYLVRLQRDTGEFLTLRMVPLRTRRLRLEGATVQDTRWLADVLERASRPYGGRIQRAGSRALRVVA